MALKRGTFFFLLIVACAALEPPDGMPEIKSDFKDMAIKLMRKCLNNGYPAPQMMQMKTLFNNCDLPMVDRNSGQPDTLLSTFIKTLQSVSPNEANKDPQVNIMTSKKCNCDHLLTTIKLMRNSSEASACYMRAFVAPLSWAILTKQSENMTSENYDTLLWAATPALQDMPSTGLKLPTDVGRPHNLNQMTEVLKNVYDGMSKDQTTQVVKWEKEQITEKYFNCTTRPPSDSRSGLMEHCKPLVKWLTLDALTMMGPYVAHLAPNDVDSSPKEQLCEFFRSDKFKFTMNMTTKMNPSLGKKFLEKFQECFSEKKAFADNVDKLGVLACHYSTPPDLTPDLSNKLLSELNNCNNDGNPKITQLKKRLVQSVMSNTNITEALHKLGTSFALLPPTKLSEIPDKDLKGVIKNLGPSVLWSRPQLRILVKKLQVMTCKEMSGEELMGLQSVAEGLPRCAFKRVKEILNDTEVMKNICQQMRKGQLMAMLQGPLGDMAPSEMVQKLSGPLLRFLPLNKLNKANITSLDQVVNKTWSQSQAAFLAKKMYDQNKLWFRDRGLCSVLQGVTCKMIDKVADSDMTDMAQAITETPQWLSKVQAGCAARKLFTTLEKKRADYFKNITEEEMKNISTYLLLHLPPVSVKDLPDSVCPTFLNKMEEADLSSLPQRSPSRPALTQRALLCLAKGTDLSGLTNEDVSRLGLLSCELPPAQLLLMAPEVLNFSLRAMASCQHIPPRYRADIIQLVTKTFGNPSDWSAETMEALGPFLLLDDNATSALPNKPWMKDVLYFLKSSLNHTSDALGKKVFDLTTTASNAARKKRAANSSVVTELTVEMIEELGMDNVYLTVAQLDGMSNSTFLATVETLGAVPGYGEKQLAALKNKAVKTLGPVSQMNESVVMQMGCITRGFPSAELEMLPFPLDTLEQIANCGWNESQMESVWKGVAKYNNLTAQQLGAADMVALSQFICGLNSSEFGKLSIIAFKDAVGSVGSVACSYKVAQQLKCLAVSAFGNPNTWTEAHVSELGNIIAGLNATELASLNPSVFSFIRKLCIALIPPHNFAGLSVLQLEALGSDNAAMVTSEQRATLTDEQLAALERALTGSPDQTQRAVQSGAPSMSVEGISAFMKPLLFLLMGFLLL